MYVQQHIKYKYIVYTIQMYLYNIDESLQLFFRVPTSRGRL